MAARPGSRGEVNDRLAAVTAVAEATTSLMALLYSSFLGAVSALLVVHVATRAFPRFDLPLQRAALGLMIWIVSTWVFSRHASRLVVVFQRACLVGAFEWLALTLWGRGEAVAHATSTALGTGRAAGARGDDLLAGGLAVVMIWVCLAGWALCRWSRPPRPDAATPSS